MDNEPNINQEAVIDPDAQKEMTPEEYKKAKEAAMKGLREEIKYLKVEEEYWRLVADIEEHKARKLLMIQRQLPFYTRQQQPAPEGEQPEGAPAPEPTPENEVDGMVPSTEGDGKPRRNLKTD